MVSTPRDIEGLVRAAQLDAATGNPDEGMQDFVIEQARVREGEELTVLQFMRQEREKAERRGLRFQSKALRNELYYLGEQFKNINEETLEVEDMDWADEVPQIYRNYLRPLVNTFSARLQKDRPDVQAFASNPHYGNVNSAEVANSLIYHAHSINEIDDLVHSSTPIAQCHGKVGYKIVWDPEAGRPGAPEEEIDETTGDIMLYEGAPEGEVRWTMETIFDYFTDGAAKTEDAEYVVFRDYIDPDLGRVLLEDAGVDEDPQQVQYSDLFDESEEGVEVLEVWHRPTKGMPDGFYALVVGGHCTEYMPEYPYDHGELPLVEWFIDSRRNSTFGSSHVDDAVVIQRQINELVSVIHKLTRDCGQLYFVGHPAIIDAMEGGGTYDIAIANERQRTNNGWIDPPNPPPLLFAQLENLIKVLYDVFGLNEILTGQDNAPAGTSARNIAYLTELDSMKLAGTAKSLAAGLKRGWRQTLKLYQQFVQEERLISIAGPGQAMNVMSFVGADIDGVDVRLEPAAGLDRMHAADAAGAEQDMMNQLIPPQEGMERRETGQDATQVAYWHQVVVQEQIRGALAGARVQPDPMVDPGAATQLIQEAMAVVSAQPTTDRMLVQNLAMLQAGYQQMAQQQQMAMMQQQAAQMGQQFAPSPQPPPGQGGHPIDPQFQGVIQ